MGVELDDDSLLLHFQPGKKTDDEPDPTLVWYVDVSCKGGSLPSAPEAVRRWLLSHESQIVRVIEALAESLPQGIDPSDWPLRREVKSGSVKITISCAAVRRIDAKRLSKILLDIATNWRSRLESLPELQPS
jgi:hypothetical protein